MREVSMVSARVMAGRMVVSRRASIDLPAPGVLSMADAGQHVSMEFRCTLWQLPHRDNDPASSEWPRILRARPLTYGFCPSTKIWVRGYCRA
jgi:hypothetical protein